MRRAIVLPHPYRALVLAFAAAGVAILAPTAFAAAPTCSTISTAVVKTALGVAVYPTASMGNSSFSGLKYLNCTYANGVTIEYISPSTSSGWSSVMSMLKKATSTTKSVSGIGSGAFSGTGTNTIATTTPGSSKTKQTTVTTENLWVYVSGKAIFEISVNNGNLSREEALAKKMVPLV